ncbi:hypothetical protein BH09ACT7_BH09ACT7_40650 [soil metagenome]
MGKVGQTRGRASLRNTVLTVAQRLLDLVGEPCRGTGGCVTTVLLLERSSACTQAVFEPNESH